MPTSFISENWHYGGEGGHQAEKFLYTRIFPNEKSANLNKDSACEFAFILQYFRLGTIRFSL